MGAEVGATTSTFPYSSNMREYLKATGRAPVAAAADKAAAQGFLSADEGAEYDQVIEIVGLNHFVYSIFFLTFLDRTCQNSSQLSMDPLHLILQRLFHSSGNLSKNKDGRMNFPPGLLGLALIALTKIW